MALGIVYPRCDNPAIRLATRKYPSGYRIASQLLVSLWKVTLCFDMINDGNDHDGEPGLCMALSYWQYALINRVPMK